MNEGTHVMSLFGTVGGAVLAAAAVIRGVWAYRNHRRNAEAPDLGQLEHMTRGSRYTTQAAVELGKVEARFLPDLLEGTRTFEELLYRVRADRAKARRLAHEYCRNYEEVIGVVREKIPEHRAWADEMEGLLSKIEGAAR